MIPEEKLKFYRRCLTECNYPNITIMALPDIEKLLMENRTSFLQWALTAFKPQYESVLEQAKHKQTLERSIATLIYENGCCYDSQKIAFVLKSLSVTDDICIFDRIFNLLTSEFANVDSENINADISTLLKNLEHPTDSIESKLFVKNKLFDTQLNIKSKTSNLETESLDKQISEMRTELELAKTENVNNVNNASTSRFDVSEGNMSRTVEKVENLISNFKDTFSEYCAHFVKTEERNVNENLDSQVKNCNENINYLKKVLVNKNFIKNLNAEVDEDKNNILSEYVTNNYKLLGDILYDEEDGDITNKSDW